jgi:hypothetical protein
MHLLTTCGDLCLWDRLQFTFDFEPLLVTGKYFEFTSYFQQAECLLAYQDDCDTYNVLLNYWQILGSGNEVGIATRNGMDVPEIQSRGRRYFLHPSRQALRPFQLPI